MAMTISTQINEAPAFHPDVLRHDPNEGGRDVLDLFSQYVMPDRRGGLPAEYLVAMQQPGLPELPTGGGGRTEAPSRDVPIPDLRDTAGLLAQAQRDRQSTAVQLFICRRLGIAGIHAAGDTTAARPRAGEADIAVTALERCVSEMMRVPDAQWRTEAVLSQSLLGFAYLQRAGVREFTPENVAAAIARGGQDARDAQAGLRAFQQARTNIEALINTLQTMRNPPPDANRQVENLRAILEAVPQVQERDGQLRLVGTPTPNALMQIALRRTTPPPLMITHPIR